MNYKYFIIGIYLTFVALILLMVFKSCSQNIELESGNYYAEELKYQSRIDAKNLGNRYRDSFQIKELDGRIMISTPVSLNSDSVRLEFKKPDKASADRNFSFKGNKITPLDKNQFISGIYGLNIRYFTREGEYLIEKKIKL